MSRIPRKTLEAKLSPYNSYLPSPKKNLEPGGMNKHAVGNIQASISGHREREGQRPITSAHFSILFSGPRKEDGGAKRKTLGCNFNPKEGRKRRRHSFRGINSTSKVIVSTAKVCFFFDRTCRQMIFFFVAGKRTNFPGEASMLLFVHVSRFVA